MDSNTKSGQVYLRPLKAGKKWKPVWLTLVPHSSSGAGRLEIQDLGGTVGEHGGRRHQGLGEKKPKVVRLSELLNVLRLPPNAEACPVENMCAFCVETQDRTLVFAALKDDCADWVEKLCLSSFQKNNVLVSNKPQMEENAIYASADDDFPVVVQRTDAAVRCGLQGAYRLQVGREALLLKDAQRSEVQRWRYELLRRYGKDKESLSIETGRRCDCGPGTLVFQTPQAETIFNLIQSTIKRKTTHTAPPGGHALEAEKSATLTTLTPLTARPRSPRPRTPDLSNVSAIFENKLKTQEAGDEAAAAAAAAAAASHPAPITLMPLPSLPTQNAAAKSDIENVYADPADCLGPRVDAAPLYVDPACILPLKPPGNGEAGQRQQEVYAEVFDRVPHGEPIYCEPVTEEEKEEKEEEKEEEEERKPDPFAHLYAQVCKTPKRSPSPQPRPQDSDVIYENLGII